MSFSARKTQRQQMLETAFHDEVNICLAYQQSIIVINSFACAIFLSTVLPDEPRCDQAAV